MNLYEMKMPGYLAMSRADLIAEILQAGDVYKAHVAELGKEPEDYLDEMIEPPQDVADASKIMDIANEVLRHRFGFTVHIDF